MAAHERESESEPRPSAREAKASKSPRVAHGSEAPSQGVQSLVSPSKPLAVSAPLATSAPLAMSAAMSAPIATSAPLAHADPSALVAQAKPSRHAEELRLVRASLLELRTELETLLGELEAE
jgi:hypothetical protein